MSELSAVCSDIPDEHVGVLRSTHRASEGELMAPACVVCTRVDEWRCPLLTNAIKFNEERCSKFEPVDADGARYERMLWGDA